MGFRLLVVSPSLVIEASQEHGSPVGGLQVHARSGAARAGLVVELFGAVRQPQSAEGSALLRRDKPGPVRIGGPVEQGAAACCEVEHGSDQSGARVDALLFALEHCILMGFYPAVLAVVGD